MAIKNVAVLGEVNAIPGDKPFTGADSGVWTAGPVNSTSYAKLKSEGKKVIWKATCNFSFSGSSSSGAAIAGNEIVNLTATVKLLNNSQSNVLVDGDNVTGIYGNKLQVSASGKLATA